VANTLAAVLIKLSHTLPISPHAYFEWSERAPAQKHAPIPPRRRRGHPPHAREILRRAVPDERDRPPIHVGG